MEDKRLKIGKTEKLNFFLRVFGCQYNEWDAVRLRFVVSEMGLNDAPEKDADVIFIMMCSVRQMAVDRVYGQIHNYSNKKIIICGCILDADRKKFEKRGAQIWDGEDTAKLSALLGIPYRKLPIADFKLQTNFIPIMKGCNNFCSYCAVPYTRGREVSRPMDEILDDIRRLLDSGEKKITLLGQNVNSYKNPNQVDISRLDKSMAQNDKREIADFAILLREINNIPGNFKVSFTSNHPKDMSDEIIEAVAQLSKIEKTIHLPLQSGSNKILKAMNRPYTNEQYLELVAKLKAKIKKLKLTTDTIVGFPGETEEDFQETVEILKKVNYYQAYNNKYSPRAGTKAFVLGDPITWEEKERRWRILNDITNRR